MPLRYEIGAGTPTRQAIRQYLEYASRRLADRTSRSYRDSLYHFCDNMPDLLSNICAEHIDRYIASRRILNSSKNTELISIRAFYSFLEQYYGIINVARKVKDFKIQPPKQRVISEIELSKILKVASEKDRSVIKFLANTGLRATEFSEFVPSCISADQKYITIIGKGNRRRVVPLNDSSRECIPMIFCGVWTRDKLSWLCRKLSQKAGIPLFGPHALRHYFVTAMIRKGASRSIVAKIAGMSETILEKTYCHLTTPDFLGTTDCLD